MGDPIGFVAYTDDCCEDASRVEPTRELAIDRWEGDEGDAYEDKTGEKADEIMTAQAVRPWIPDRAWDDAVESALDALDSWASDRPEGMDWPPVAKSSQAWERLRETMTTAILDYLKAATGVRGCDWWEGEDEEAWVLVDGEWRKKA